MQIDSKKALLEVLIVVLLLSVIGLFVVKFNKRIIPSIRNYSVYLRAGETIKLDFYIDCYVNKCESPKVSGYTILNKETRKLLKDEDLTIQNELFDVVKKTLDTFKKKGIEYSTIELYSDYKDITTYINRKNINYEYSIFSKYINRDNLSDLNFDLLNNKNLYIVNFVTLSDETIDDVLVEEGETITKPKLKNKDGYKFSSWLYNDKEFDFDTKIFKSITLVADYKKIDEETPLKESVEGAIDLKDNVSYSITERKYYYIKDECINKNYEELLSLFPSSLKELNELSEDNKIDANFYRAFLSNCKQNVDEDYIELVNRTMSTRVKSVKNNEIIILGLNINNDKYSSYSYPKDVINCKNCELIEETNTDVVGTLNIDVCSTFNLECSSL